MTVQTLAERLTEAIGAAAIVAAVVVSPCAAVPTRSPLLPAPVWVAIEGGQDRCVPRHRTVTRRRATTRPR